MIIINEETNTLTVKKANSEKTLNLASQEGFLELSRIWLKSSWDTQHMYSFTWLGVPIIQLPEDLIRIQELIFTIKPDIIIETGVNYGGSVLFYASLCKLLGKGNVIGIELRARDELKCALHNHPLSHLITIIEGSSIEQTVLNEVNSLVPTNKTVLVILDSKHTKAHVAAELAAYTQLVSIGSYIIVMDGIIGELEGCKRSGDTWSWDNPAQAAKEFVEQHKNFIIQNPPFLFNGGQITQPITNCPYGFIKRIA